MNAVLPARNIETASVLVIVLWVSLGLVSLALYFAHAMNFQMRAADNRVANFEAAQVVEGAARYITNVLGQYATNGAAPDTLLFDSEAVQVGDATFWFIGRDTNLWQGTLTRPTFGLIDEASKLNLNTATRAMLELLPGMTTELAGSIIDWRDTDSEVTDSGAEDDTYARLNPPYHCKNAPFESIEELRLVANSNLRALFGEDVNLNGVLDPNEDDGEESFPYDNRDGRLDPGILEYVTVATREPNTKGDGSTRVNVSDPSQAAVASYLQQQLGTQRANAILRQFGVGSTGGGGRGGTGGTPPGGAGGGTPAPTVRSVLEFALLGGITADELGPIEGDLTVTNATSLQGLINVNTASTEVLACVPGIGAESAQSVVAARASNGTKGSSLMWIVDVLGRENALTAAPYLTTRSYQFTADIVAIGHHNRGYQRVRFLVDMSDGTPRIRARRDLTHLGWALGREIREQADQLASRKQ